MIVQHLKRLVYTTRFMLYSCAIDVVGTRATVHKPLVLHACDTYMPVYCYLEIYEYCVSMMLQLSCVVFRCYATLWASSVVVLLNISWLIFALEVRNKVLLVSIKHNSLQWLFWPMTIPFFFFFAHTNGGTHVRVTNRELQ